MEYFEDSAKRLALMLHYVSLRAKFEPDPPECFGGGKRGCFAKVSITDEVDFLWDFMILQFMI